MRSYVRKIRDFGPDVKLFLVYNLLANVGYGVFQLIFNLYLLKLSFREDAIGEFTAAQTICMGIGGATLGVMLNRFGTWRCIVGGFTVIIAAALALSFAEHRLILLLLSAVYGLGLSYLFNPLMPFILEWCRTDQRQHAAAVSFSIVSLSVTIGSLVGGLAPSLLGRAVPNIAGATVETYRWTLVIGTMVAALGLVPLLLMGAPRHAPARRESRAARRTEDPSERRQVRRDMAVFITVGGIMSLGVGMVIPFYNVFLTTLGASDRQVGYVFALGSASAAVIGLTAPAVANRLGSLRAVAILRILIVPFYLPLIFFPGFWLAVVAHISRQVGISMAWPIDSTFIGELLPARSRSSVYGLRSGAWNLGYALAGFIAGKLIVSHGYGPTFASIIVCTTAAAVLFVSYYSRHPSVRAGRIPSALPRGAAARIETLRASTGHGAAAVDTESRPTAVT